MGKMLEILAELAQNSYTKQCYAAWLKAPVKEYLSSGDPKAFAKIAAFKDDDCPYALIEAMGAPGRLGEEGERLLRILVSQNNSLGLGRWLMKLHQEAPKEFSEAVKRVTALGGGPELICRGLGSRLNGVDLTDDSPVLAFIATVSEECLERLVGEDWEQHWTLRQAFCRVLAERYARVLAKAEKQGKVGKDFPLHVAELMEANPGKYADLAEKALVLAKDGHDRFEVLKHLALANPGHYGPQVDELAGQLLPGKEPWHTEMEMAEWLVQHRSATALPLAARYLASPLKAEAWSRKVGGEYKIELLQAAAALGAAAVPLYESCFLTDQGEVQLQALRQWIALKLPADREAIVARLRQLFEASDASAVARAARLAGDFGAETVEPELWSMLAHRSRPVREAAAATLARLGESRLGKAAELWQARKADARVATVSWLRNLGTAGAAAALKARLEDEEAEDVRDAILLALERVAGTTEEVDTAELKRRIRKTVEKLTEPTVRWLDLKKLPAAKLKDGKKLETDALQYLLYRQSRVKEMRTDIEARALYSKVDRKTSGDLALHVLQAYFQSKVDSEERWIMAFTAALGDDRLVPVFTHQIKEWAEAMRGKLAEYAVQALALLGTDVALLAVDAMSIRYRSKNKNIGKAASDAFAAAAAARGLTVEELGDLVVPWLGFTSGPTRILDAGKAKVEMRIGSDFKLAFRDVATHKKLAKPPSSTPAALQKELKEIAAGLKEAVKAQLLRLESLMVRQFRWPEARWRELFLRHPLLLPFGQRLVWGAYDAAQKLVRTFRALEDGTLTDAADEPCKLPAQAAIGVLHPLELGTEARQAWLRHLADYQVVPPFSQMERTVVTASSEQKEVRFGKDLVGRELNAMTFKGRAERLGWCRGSVCDAGGIGFYLKTFPVAGVDVFLELDGMYVGIDMESDIKLGKVFFTRHGTVAIGSYEYDEPGDEKDARLVAFGAVPPIAFSEAMGDLLKIAGESAKEAEE